MWWKNGRMCDCKLCVEHSALNVLILNESTSANVLAFFFLLSVVSLKCVCVFANSTAKYEIKLKMTHRKRRRKENSMHEHIGLIELHTRSPFIPCTIYFTYIKRCSKLCLNEKNETREREKAATTFATLWQCSVEPGERELHRTVDVIYWNIWYPFHSHLYAETKTSAHLCVSVQYRLAKCNRKMVIWKETNRSQCWRQKKCRWREKRKGKRTKNCIHFSIKSI